MALPFDLHSTLIDIRESVAKAIELEQQTGQLSACLKEQLEQLHRAVCLPDKAPKEALFRFAVDYIHAAPDCIEALHTLSVDAAATTYSDHFITTTCQYFNAPPAIIQDYTGLRLLLNQAYLAHRLLEEVNDQVASISGFQLVPMDMAHASLIMHCVLGESLANQLDHLVLLDIELSPVKKELLDTEAFAHHQKTRAQQGWGEVLTRWPRLQNDLVIELQFGQTITVNLGENSH